MRILAPLARLLGAGALCAVVAGQSACRGDGGAASHAQATPSKEPAPTAAASSPSAASAPAAPVGLAKYEEPGGASAAPTAPAPAAAAPAPTPASAPAPAGAPPSKAAAGEPVKGPVVKEEPFEVWLQAVSPVPAGSPAKLEAVLIAHPPYHCNAEYPHKLKLGAAPPGLAYPEATVKGMKVTPSRGVLEVPVQAQSAGKAKVAGILQFSVCDDERCLVEKRDLSLELEVR